MVRLVRPSSGGALLHRASTYCGLACLHDLAATNAARTSCHAVDAEVDKKNLPWHIVHVGFLQDDSLSRSKKTTLQLVHSQILAPASHRRALSF